MENKYHPFRLVYFAVVLFVLLFAHIRLFITTQGLFLYLELLGFFLLSILSIIGFVGYGKRWGEYPFLVVFSLYLINLLLILYFYGDLYVVLLVLALIGFFVALPLSHPKVKKEEEPHSVVFDTEKTQPSIDAAKTVAV